MTVSGWAQIVTFIVVLTALTPLLGGYLARVYQGRRVVLSPVAAPVERLLTAFYVWTRVRIRIGRPTRARC
jgi:K+-transporting ATPase ATPase A chain